MSDLARFRAEVDAVGGGTVEVNGEPVRVQAFTVQARVGQPPLLVLQQYAGDALIEGDGIVHVSTQGVDPTKAVVDFLNTIDAEELEQQVLLNSGWGEGNTMAVAIDILRKWAHERSSA